MSKHLTKRAEDYSKWYNELIVKADLAENSAVRGCMVIKPYGFAIWEKMQAELDWVPEETFETGLRKTVQWYLENNEWCENVQSGSYQRERLGELEGN